MTPGQYRALLALANVVLVALIALLGARTFVGTAAPANESPPVDFDPLKYEIKNEGGQRSSVDEHAPTWQELDRPLPPPPPPTQVDVGPPPAPTPQDLSRLYTLVMASFNERDPSLSSMIIQGRDGAQRTYAVGDSFDGYQVVDIRIQGDGDTREAIVTLQSSSGARETIPLRRRSQP
jgi:hypothetical protein